ncbi:hypothetical protein E4U60_006335 [Claviceps pazoutovae]|uniref:Uncharacterized protein n=1 Tax=Claviceps pazoutovae TaxID=1649127 RepID=A0A9P7M6W2_9HYPO|nr:hypothetical protein E4U60_006335 [Claviceps pazoutovae]
MSSPKHEIEIEIEIEQAAETTRTRLQEFRDILKHRAWQREMAAAAGVSYWHLQPLRLEECAHLFPLIYTDEQYSQLLDDFPMEAFEVYGLWGIYAFPSPCESAEGGQQAMHASRKAGEQESLSLKMEPSATPTGEKQIKNKKAKKKVRIEKEGGWVNLEVAFKVLTRESGDERWMSKPCPRRVTRKRPESTRGPGPRGHGVSRSRNVAGS